MEYLVNIYNLSYLGNFLWRFPSKNVRVHSAQKYVWNQFLRLTDFTKETQQLQEFSSYPLFQESHLNINGILLLQFTRFSLRNGILLPKLFWPTVKKKCFGDREKTRGWRPRICKIFEITWTIYSNTERSEQSLVTESFFNLFLEVSQSYKIRTIVIVGI